MAYLEVSKDIPIKVKVGQILIYDYEGSPIYLKIMRKSKGKVYAKRLDPAKFLTPEEADEQVTIVPK